MDNFTLKSQELIIKNVNIPERFIYGKVIMKFKKNRTETNDKFEKIWIDCNGPKINSTINLLNKKKEKLKLNFSKLESIGKLLIYLPNDFCDFCNNKKHFKISMKFITQHPISGLVFNLDKCVYTAPLNKCSSKIFPCIEFGQMCKWTLKYEPDKQDSNIVHALFTGLFDRKKSQYKVKSPTNARNIGFILNVIEPKVHNFPNVQLYDSTYRSGNIVNANHNLFGPCINHVNELFGGLAYTQSNCVIVDNSTEDSYCFSNLIIIDIRVFLKQYYSTICHESLSTNFLRCLFEQFFGCIINCPNFNDNWLFVGLVEYLVFKYIHLLNKSTFLEILKWEMDRNLDKEDILGGIELAVDKLNEFYKVLQPAKYSKFYLEIYRMKCGLIIWGLESCSFNLQDVVVNLISQNIQTLSYKDFLSFISLTDNYIESLNYHIYQKGYTEVHLMYKWEKIGKVYIVETKQIRKTNFYNGFLRLEFREPFEEVSINPLYIKIDEAVQTQTIGAAHEIKYHKSKTVFHGILCIDSQLSIYGRLHLEITNKNENLITQTIFDETYYFTNFLISNCHKKISDDNLWSAFNHIKNKETTIFYVKHLLEMADRCKLPNKIQLLSDIIFFKHLKYTEDNKFQPILKFEYIDEFLIFFDFLEKLYEIVEINSDGDFELWFDVAFNIIEVSSGIKKKNYPHIYLKARIYKCLIKLITKLKGRYLNLKQTHDIMAYITMDVERYKNDITDLWKFILYETLLEMYAVLMKCSKIIYDKLIFTDCFGDEKLLISSVKAMCKLIHNDNTIKFDVMKDIFDIISNKSLSLITQISCIELVELELYHLKQSNDSLIASIVSSTQWKKFIQIMSNIDEYGNNVQVHIQEMTYILETELNSDCICSNKNKDYSKKVSRKRKVEK